MSCTEMAGPIQRLRLARATHMLALCWHPPLTLPQLLLVCVLPDALEPLGEVLPSCPINFKDGWQEEHVCLVAMVLVLRFLDLLPLLSWAVH